MLKDLDKYFNNEDDYCTNRQLIGYEYLFRGVIVKYWVMENCNSVNFHPHNKVLIGNSVKHYHDSWEKRCVVLYSPDVQKKVLKEDLLEIIEKASKDEVVGLRRYVEVHKMTGNDGTIEEMVSWVRSVILLRDERKIELINI